MRYVREEYQVKYVKQICSTHLANDTLGNWSRVEQDAFKAGLHQLETKPKFGVREEVAKEVDNSLMTTASKNLDLVDHVIHLVVIITNKHLLDSHLGARLPVEHGIDTTETTRTQVGQVEKVIGSD